MLHSSLSRWLVLALLYALATANVEKIVFMAPVRQPMPPDASIDSLLLPPLSERSPSIRTHLQRSFPTEEAPKGTASWILLEELVCNRRYELRVTWIATQPTLFDLQEYNIDVAFGDPKLLTSLTNYSNARYASVSQTELDYFRSRKDARLAQPSVAETTFLFVQIFAKADYFTLNKTMMDVVDDVQVDIILDYYLWNVFPHSLIPTAAYLVIIAITGWFLSTWAIRFLIRPLATDTAAPPPRRKRG